ncbi:MAG: hypothetical protein E7575_06130 [Ruminococcaceae bacterium]|nr:hypothetical protein [Oscillospiraceae bacterium]
MVNVGKYSIARYLGGSKYEIYLRRSGPGTELLGIYNGFIAKGGNTMKLYIKSPAIGVRYGQIPGKDEVFCSDLLREPGYI